MYLRRCNHLNICRPPVTSTACRPCHFLAGLGGVSPLRLDVLERVRWALDRVVGSMELAPWIIKHDLLSMQHAVLVHGMPSMGHIACIVCERT